jgi:NTE family protein
MSNILKISLKILLLSSLFLFLPVDLYPQSIMNGKKSPDFIIKPDYDTIINPNYRPIPEIKIRNPKVALILSGGGARGISHIGILKVFEKYHIPIDIIYGTSIGAIVGGLYAIGYNPEELKEVIKNINMSDMLSLTNESKRMDLYPEQKKAQAQSFLTLRFSGLEPVLPSSVSTGQQITNLINLTVLQGLHHNHKNFNDFPIPFRAVTTDLISGKTVVLLDGDLSEAIRASFTWPLLNPTIERDSMRLLDGGIFANIPAHFAKAEKYDLSIAVNTTTPIRTKSQINTAFDVLDQLLSIMQEKFNENELKSADIIIQPKLERFSNTDFKEVDSLVTLGEKAAELKIDEILRLLDTKKPYNGSNESLFISHIDFSGDTLNKDVQNKIRSSFENRFTKINDIRYTLSEIHNLNIYSDVKCSVYKDSNTSRLEFILKAYPSIHSLKILGNFLVDMDSLMPIFKPVLHKPYNHKAIRAIIDSVLRIYRSNYYSLAYIESFTFDTLNGVLSLVFNEGKIKRIDLIGNKKTQDYLIFREFPLQKGEIFNSKKAHDGLINLTSTNLFNKIILDIFYEDNEPVVKVKLDEKPAELIRFGVRIDNEKNSQFSVDVRNENLGGGGYDFGLFLHGGYRSFQTILDFKTNKVFKTPLTYKIKLKYQFEDLSVYENEPTDNINTWRREKIGDFRESKLGGSVMLGSQIRKLGYLYGEYSFEKQRITSNSGTGFPLDNHKISILKGGLIIDSQNDYPFPTDGMYFNAYYETSLAGLGADVAFIKYYIDFSQYFTYKGNYTLRPRVVFGYGDNTLPYAEQFRIGGQNTFFGFRENEYRGRQIFIGSLEYRWFLPIKIFFDTYFSLRFDMGSTWERATDIRVKDLRYGIGSSISMATPIGPAQFSVGNSFNFIRDLPNNPISFGPIFFYFTMGYDLDF